MSELRSNSASNSKRLYEDIGNCWEPVEDEKCKHEKDLCSNVDVQRQRGINCIELFDILARHSITKDILEKEN